MTVYHKIVRTKSSKEDINKIIRGSGIDYVSLGESAGIDQITVEFICSDNNPTESRTMDDIDNLLTKLDVVKELNEHRNEPTKHTNHLLQISQKKDDQEGTEETREVERG